MAFFSILSYKPKLVVADAVAAVAAAEVVAAKVTQVAGVPVVVAVVAQVAVGVVVAAAVVVAAVTVVATAVAAAAVQCFFHRVGQWLVVDKHPYGPSRMHDEPAVFAIHVPRGFLVTTTFIPVTPLPC